MQSRDILRVLSVVCLIVLFASYSYCSEETGEQEKAQPRHVPRPGIKGVKSPKPDIPYEYKSLAKAYEDYWNLIIKQEFEKAYYMESSEYRKVNPYGKEKYEAMIPKNIKLTSVIAVNVEKKDEKEVVVKGNYYYEIGALKSVKPFFDRWMKEEEAWKHIPTDGQFK